MTTPKTRVFIVDDHPLVRESLAGLIDQQPDLSVCGEADRSSAALAAIGSAQPDVTIVDLSLADGSGLDLIRDLRQQYPRVAVLVLSMHDESLYAERALRAGARGYLMKRAASRDVVVAIRRVREGRIAVSPELAEARQIADALHLSAKTVQTYCARIKDKLGLNTANELLREAVRWLAERDRA